MLIKHEGNPAVGIINSFLIMAYAAIVVLLVFHVPRIIIFLSDLIIKWTDGNITTIAFLTGVGIGLSAGIVLSFIFKQTRSEVYDWTESGEPGIAAKLIRALDIKDGGKNGN